MGILGIFEQHILKIPKIPENSLNKFSQIGTPHHLPDKFSPRPWNYGSWTWKSSQCSSFKTKKKQHILTFLIDLQATKIFTTHWIHMP